jgi:hypothetical protein
LEHMRLLRDGLFLLLIGSTAIAAGTISLGQVRKIYVERMPNDLDQHVRIEIYKQFKDKVAVVLDRREADGILMAPAAKPTISTAATPLSSALRGNGDLMVSLLDKSGKVILWSDDLGDRDAMFRNIGSRTVAERIIHKLKRAIEHSR